MSFKKKHISRLIIIITFLGIFSIPRISAQKKLSELSKHFTRENNVARICSDIEITDNGLVLIATGYGINYFNGYAWDADIIIDTLMPPKFTKLRKDQENTNKYYVGGLGKCGFFTLGKDDFLFKEIISSEENKKKLGGNLSNIYQIKNLVFFLGVSSGCIIYNKQTGKKKYVPPINDGKYSYSFQIKENVYIRSSAGTIFKIFGYNWIRIKKYPEIIQKYKPVFFKQINDNVTVFISQEKKFCIKEKNSVIKEIPMITSLIKEGFRFRVRKQNDQLVILTNKKLIKFDLQDRVIRFVYNFKQVITNNFAFDSQGNTWVTTNNGVFYIELNDKFTFKQNKRGIKKSKLQENYTINFFRSGGVIEINTTNSSNEIKFDGFVSDVLLDDNHFIISTSKGLFKTNKSGTNIIKILDKRFNKMLVYTPRDRDKIFLLFDLRNLLILDKNYKIKATIKLKTRGANEALISTNGVIYYATVNEVYQIKLSPDFKSVLSQKKLAFPIKTRYSFSFFEKNKQVHLVNALGLFKIDQHKKITCLTANLKGLSLNKQGIYHQRFSFAKHLSHNRFFIIPVYSGGDEAKSFPGILSKDQSGEYAFETRDFKRIGKIVTTDVKKLDSDHIQLITQKKIITCNLKTKNTIVDKFNSYIREVFIKKNIPDSLQDGLSDDNYQNLKIYNGITRQYKVEKIPYNTNSISFKFASDNYVAMEANNYSYQLEGLDKTWSNWSKEQKKEYTHLREGTYTFNVRCKNVYGTISSVDSYTFTILPPWYRTTWAYLAYALATITLLAGGSIGYSRYRSRKLRKRNRELEQVVEERTQEIRAQKEEITQQAENLKATNQELVKAHELVKQEKDEKVRIYLEEATEAVNTLQEVYEAFTLKGADFAQKLLKNEINTAGELALIREKVRQEFPDFAYQIDQALANKKITKIVWQVGHCLKLGRSPADVSKILPLGNRTVSVYGTKLRKMGILEAVKKDA